MIISTLLFVALLPTTTAFGYHQSAAYSMAVASSRNDLIADRRRRLCGRWLNPGRIHPLDATHISTRRTNYLLDCASSLTKQHNIVMTKMYNNILTARSKIRQMILNILIRLTDDVRVAALKLSPLILSLALMFSIPTNSWSASSRNLLQSSSTMESPSSYYDLQNNLQLGPQRTRSIISIRTQESQPYSSASNEYKIKRRSNKGDKREQETVKRISLFVILATIAASSFRASLRKTKIVRTTTPFGRIRNVSPLGNGVSVIRVCMALGLNEGNGADDGLLQKLHLEEKEHYSKITTLDQLQGNNSYEFRQKALGDYISSVASSFLPYQKFIRYGSINSVRVPFVEEAVTEFRRAAKEERKMFDRQEQMLAFEQAPQKKTSYILATILLCIKGDHTSVNLPFGIIRQRDMARELSTIVTDAKVDGCLVASEVMLLPDATTNILKSFPDLVPLT